MQLPLIPGLEGDGVSTEKETPEYTEPMSAGRLYLGTQGFSYPSWVGSFYPPGTPQAKWLDYFATQFNTVELDTTFYALPRESTIDGWREKTPDGFVFSAKFPKIITHEKLLLGASDETNYFLHGMDRLGHKLGPLVLQMPPSFAADQFNVLSSYMESLPAGFRYVVEVRHRSWLTKDMKPKLFDLLHKHGAAICLVHHAWMPHLDERTADFVYIRWLGRREDIPDDDFSAIRINRDKALDEWAPQLREYLRQDTTIFGYFNNHFAGHSPASVRAMEKRLADASSG